MAEKELIKIEKNGNVLEVDERRFRIFYKGVGYKKVELEASETVDDNNQEPDGDEGGQEPADDNGEGSEVEGLPAYDDITKPQILERLKEKGVDHNPRDSKEVLYALLEGE